MIVAIILAVAFYIIGFILFSGIYCGMEFTKTEDLLTCIFYPITIWYIK